MIQTGCISDVALSAHKNAESDSAWADKIGVRWLLGIALYDRGLADPSQLFGEFKVFFIETNILSRTTRRRLGLNSHTFEYNG